MNAILLLTAPILLLIPAFGLLVRKLFARTTAPAITGEWLDSLSMSRYTPMERLLEGREFQYLAAQPGLNRRVVYRVRAERVKLFRMYAKCLDRDFNRICTAIKMVMIHSQVDRPELATMLLKKRFAFTVALVGIEYRLAMCRFGVGEVSVRQLLGAMDTVRVQLRDLTLVAQPSAA